MNEENKGDCKNQHLRYTREYVIDTRIMDVLLGTQMALVSSVVRTIHCDWRSMAGDDVHNYFKRSTVYELTLFMTMHPKAYLSYYILTYR